ncbi:hypothetical protein ACE6H2_007273 [Prunus campanulata]
MMRLGPTPPRSFKHKAKRSRGIGRKVEAEAAVAAKVVVSVLLGGFSVFFFLYLCELVLLRLRGLRSKLGKQGIRGPPPSFLTLREPLCHKEAPKQGLVNSNKDC